MSTGLIDPFGDDEVSGGRPSQPVRPAPAPIQTGSVLTAPGSSVTRLLEIAGIVLITAAITTGLVAWKLGGRGDGPKPSADAVALGRSFAPILAGTLADGFEEGATQLRAGKTFGEADTALKATFDKARKAAFDTHASGAIHAIVPDGKELEPAQREAVISLFTGFAKGLREAK